MFYFEKSITINKTPHEVFSFVADPSKTPQWRFDVIETKTQSLPLKVGDKMEEITDFNGIKACSVIVVEMLPDRKLVLKAIAGTTYLPKRELTFEQEGEHTKFTIKISAHSDGFSRFIEPLSSNMYSLKWDTYLFSLKKVLEAL
ncbi:MAG: Polyketide cyclase / dehydrase and lipid transport [Bacteroidota bacterium]|nr:Polyketide cyclase / dehydrase and lipid transport [Bacteroidota bacterium]